VQKIKDIKSKLGKWFWVILGIIILVAWYMIASSNKSLKVETAQVSKGNLILSVSTSGLVHADQYSALTFPSGGKIASVRVKAGDKVKKGQVIASLDLISLNAVYQQALNNRRSTQATVDSVHDQVKDSSSTETFAQKATRTAAEVANDNAWDTVRAAQENLNNAISYAPFDGFVDTVNPSSPGINVMPGAANYTIVNPDTVYFDAEVTELDLPNLALSQQVKVKLDAYPDQDFNGIVESIGMVAFTSSTGGNAYHVRVSFPGNEEQKIKVGMGGDAEIIYNTISETLKVPAFAVVSEPSNYVWIIEKNRVKKVNVEIGQSSIDETEIKSGLSGGETVITQPPANLKEGQRVQF
jgi:RND family efflux transporter MFP subunit